MKTQIIILVLIGMCIGTWFVDFDKLAPQDLIASTVLITDGHGHGSGVYLGNGIILTAWHCTGMDNAWVEDMYGNQFAILEEVYCGDWTEDIGFIKINPKADIPAMTRFGDMPEIGDKAYICGNPLDIVMFGNFTTGTITKVGVDIPGWWDDAIISDATACPGNSGGGVYNEDYELIGILVGGYIGYDNISIIEPISDILRMMNLKLD